MEVAGTQVRVTVPVKNTGAALGKEVVQLYVSLPSGKLDQPYQVLAAFEKTGQLAPGQEEALTLAFALESLASFDESTAASILEAGDYLLRLGTSSRDTQLCGVVRLEGEVTVRQLSHVGGKPDFVDWKPENPFHGQEDLAGVPVFPVKPEAYQPKPIPAQPEISQEIRQLVASLSDEELAYVCLGGFRDQGSDSVIGSAGIHVVGAAGETTGRFQEKGLPVLVMADGPAGLRLSRDYGQDENGVYPLGDTMPPGFADFMEEDALEGLGAGKLCRSVTGRCSISIAPPFPSAPLWPKAGTWPCAKPAAIW